MELTAGQRTVMRMIESAAALGLPCPKNMEIAGATGCSSVSCGPKFLAQLERLGLIEVDRGPMNRVVTILATGKRTAGEVVKDHWSRRNVVRKMPQPKVPGPAVVMKKGDLPAPPRVYREPCPRCGVRADIGCGHSGAPLSVGAAA